MKALTWWPTYYRAIRGDRRWRTHRTSTRRYAVRTAWALAKWRAGIIGWRWQA